MGTIWIRNNEEYRKLAKDSNPWNESELIYSDNTLKIGDRTMKAKFLNPIITGDHFWFEITKVEEQYVYLKKAEVTEENLSKIVS